MSSGGFFAALRSRVSQAGSIAATDAKRLIFELQLKEMYKNIDLAHYRPRFQTEAFKRYRVTRGYDESIRGRLLKYVHRNNEDYTYTKSRIKIYESMTRSERRRFASLTGRERSKIADIARVSDEDVDEYIEDLKSMKSIFDVLRRRWLKGMANATSEADVAYIQTTPQQCFSRRNEMMNPWQKVSDRRTNVFPQRARDINPQQF